VNTSADIFTDKLIARICEELEQNQVIRQKFPEWGRLHIDRRIPLLCVYRQPINDSDKGTDRLLLGQSGYILVRQQLADSDGFKAMIAALLSRLSNRFGSCLLFELWTEEKPESKALFNIKTSKKQAPVDALEELETALLDIPIKHQKKLSLEYTTQSKPPLLPPLLNQQQLVKLNCYWLGLGLLPIFRSKNELYPYTLRELHHGLTHALRRCLFIFARRYTSHKPLHFHELGRQFMTDMVWLTDKNLAEIKQQFDILFHVTPVNSEQAWQEFEKSGFSQAPVFNYRPRPIDPDILKRALYKIPIEKIEDPTLGYVFRSQREEIDYQLSMISERNHRNFLYSSLQVYGGVEAPLLTLSERILKEVSVENLVAEDGYLSAKQFAGRAQKLLDDYTNQLPQREGQVQIRSQVQVREDVLGIMVSNNNLMMNPHMRFRKDTAEATLAHEVGTHLVTYFNGKSQPFHQLYSGMANYEPLQEALAVLAEYLVGGLTNNRLRILAARVIAVHSLIEGASFVEVVQYLHQQYDFPYHQAFIISTRVFRGGGFTKDAIYLKGLSQLLEYLADGGNLETLYLGKISLEDVPLVEELKWRKILKEGPLSPHFLKTEECIRRLKKVQQGLTVIELVKPASNLLNLNLTRGN
jgi:uncharacterized protein (TIGR02421 family)